MTKLLRKMERQGSVEDIGRQGSGEAISGLILLWLFESKKAVSAILTKLLRTSVSKAVVKIYLGK